MAIRKVIGLILATALVAWAPMVGLDAHAQSGATAAKKEQSAKTHGADSRMLEIAKKIKALQKEGATPKATRAEETDELVFKGQINRFETHVYSFDLKDEGPVFLVGDARLETQLFDSNMAPVSPNDLLPVGNYILMVSRVIGEPESEYGYEIQLRDGTFSAQSTEVPHLRVDSFQSHMHSPVPKGANEVRLQGETSGNIVFAYQNLTDTIRLSAPSFSQTVPLDETVNRFDFYTYSSDSGNWTVETYFPVNRGVERLGGKDRFVVSTEVSWELQRYLDEKIDTVVIARGDLFTDSLSASSLNDHMDFPVESKHPYRGTHPVLLTMPQSLPESVKNHLRIIKPKRAIILGGTDSVSANVVNQLRQLGVKEIKRIDGNDRFAVSVHAAQISLEGAGSAKAYIANGMNFPDAMITSAYAGAGKPLLLVKPDQLPSVTANFIKEAQIIEEFVVVGGSSSVSDQVVRQIKSLNPRAKVTRIGGANRFEVSANMAKHHWQGQAPANIKLARGDVFSDAVTGGPLASYEKGPLLLTMPTKMDPAVKSYLIRHSDSLDFAHIFGGTDSVSAAIEKWVYGLIR